MSKCILDHMRMSYLSQQQQFKAIKFGKKSSKKQSELVSTSSFDFIIQEENLKTLYTKSGEKMIMEELDVSTHSNIKQLDSISESLQGLTGLLTEMEEKVLQQGEMVDRIDENTQVSLEMTKKANKVLIESKEIMENSCASKLQKYLFLINLCLLVSIIIKFYYLN